MNEKLKELTKKHPDLYSFFLGVSVIGAFALLCYLVTTFLYCLIAFLVVSGGIMIYGFGDSIRRNLEE